MAEERIYVVTEDGIDESMSREIARVGSDTRRALDGWALTSGVPVGGGTGGTVWGSSPIAITLHPDGDGTAYLDILGAGVRVEEVEAGFVDLIFEGGSQ